MWYNQAVKKAVGWIDKNLELEKQEFAKRLHVYQVYYLNITLTSAFPYRCCNCKKFYAGSDW